MQLTFPASHPQITAAKTVCSAKFRYIRHLHILLSGKCLVLDQERFDALAVISDWRYSHFPIFFLLPQIFSYTEQSYSTNQSPPKPSLMMGANLNRISKWLFSPTSILSTSFYKSSLDNLTSLDAVYKSSIHSIHSCF